MEAFKKIVWCVLSYSKFYLNYIIAVLLQKKKKKQATFMGVKSIKENVKPIPK